MAISSSLGFIVMLFSCIAILPDFSSAQGSCRTRCGEDYYRGHACHCDYNCLLHKECCPDYEGLCTTANSCKGRCGEDFQRGRKCDCDAGCFEFNQCCPDYQSHCLKETPKTTVANPTTVPITTRANTPQVQATKKLAVNLSTLIQKPVPTTQSASTASSRFQAIETTASDSNSANEEMIQDLSKSQLITLSTLPPANHPTSRPAVTTMQLETLKYPEFQRDDETVLLELTEAMPYQEQFLPSITHSFSTEPTAPSRVFSILQSTTEASTKPEEHANPTGPLVLESDTIRPAVTEQTTPSAAINDQEPETPSESDTTRPAVTEQTTTPSAAVNDQEPETPSESDTTRPAVTEQTTPSAAVNDQESETLSESDTTGPAVTEQTTTPSAAVNDQEPETPSESDTKRPAVTDQTTPSAAVNDQEPETPSESDTTRPAVTEQTTTPSAAVNDQEPETPSESDTTRPSAAVNDQESETPSESDTTGPAVTEQTTTPSAAVNDQEPETPSESDTKRPAVTDQTTPSAAVNDQEPETLSESDTTRPAVTEQTTTPSAAVNDQEPETPSESETTRPAVTEQITPSAAVNDQEPETPSESETTRPAVTEQTTTPSAVNDQEPDTPSESGFDPSMTDAPETDTPSPPEGVWSTPSSTTTDPTRNVLLAVCLDDNDDDNLCSGRPVNGITTLLNGTMYAFRGHWFWMLNSYGIEVGYPRRITDVWGIPSPIDSVFTRCNCQGKTFFFKGSNYWRFENGGMDSGYPKLISIGFGGIKGQITAALSVSSSWRRPESVYFFKQGGLVQKYSYTQKPPQTCKKMQTQYSIYSIRNRFARQLSSQSKATVTLGQEINIKLQWRGFPTSVTSAISVPNARKPDGYDYFVFSRTRYYNINILADQPTVTSTSPSSERQQSTAKDWFKCP
ncbi:proteoglycan 4-like isoform X3 [Acipenser oxyrinchus oxyrinchus]|uniref:Proteoglycan 4-like isoform X3 n=1 Tax=Acipenser oxyrinchus oxyrinchus TaxID=40147 RepID=A0AAD8G3T5_ACIOX|nr:proteoglycan 4-like isoform X3 [Acipenser oxyrinchus oxyrinchus]